MRLRKTDLELLAKLEEGMGKIEALELDGEITEESLEEFERLMDELVEESES